MDGQACIDGTGIKDGCYEASVALNAAIHIVDAAVTQDDDGSWTIDRIPEQCSLKSERYG